MKTCVCCGQDKPDTAFRFNKQRGKLFPYCHTCEAARARQWRQDNPGYMRRYMRAYRLRHAPAQPARPLVARHAEAKGRRFAAILAGVGK